MTDKVAIILKGYPRLSETFIAQELRGLELAGLELALFSMRRPTDKQVHPVHREIEAEVSYLPEYLHDEPARVFRAWKRLRNTQGYAAAYKAFRHDLTWDFSRNRFRRFGQALVLANELPGDIAHLHAHFMHTPASVVYYTSLLKSMAWTCSAHAKDIWTSPEIDLKRKLETAEWVVTCTQTGHAYLQSLAPQPQQVHLSYHGLNLERFASPGKSEMTRDGTDPQAPVRLITVCRAVEKKGLDTLIEALAQLPSAIHWHWTHIGGGELIQSLKEKAQVAGITGHVSWLGAVAQEQVLNELRQSDLFVLPCRIAANGDRDGLPNVIVEAQSQALPVVSTTVSGVPELIENDVNGLLVDPDNPGQLMKGLEALIGDPQRRSTMGNKGENRVRTEFDYDVSVSFLKTMFDRVMTSRGER